VALSDKAVVRLVQQAAAGAGLDPARFSGHSLRAGLATGLADVMHRTRPKLWRNNIAARVFAASDGMCHATRVGGLY
jgi:hypothetical protein